MSDLKEEIMTKMLKWVKALRPKSAMRRSKSFTLIELLVVVAARPLYDCYGIKNVSVCCRSEKREVQGHGILPAGETRRTVVVYHAGG